MRSLFLTYFFSCIPAIVMLIGGGLFIRFNGKFWNNPVNFIFKDQRPLINEETGKIWLLEGLFLLLISLGFSLYRYPVFLVLLYLVGIIISYLPVYLHAKERINSKID